jgi:hypothetical protein
MVAGVTVGENGTSSAINPLPDRSKYTLCDPFVIVFTVGATVNAFALAPTLVILPSDLIIMYPVKQSYTLTILLDLIVSCNDENVVVKLVVLYEPTDPHHINVLSP